MPVRLASRIVAAGFVVAAAAYALTALSAIANHAWRWPMFDQYRLYSYYLALPFPENILQLENGHRPIVPALLRVFEIWCCSANQLLQIIVGTGLALSAVLVAAALAMRAQGIALVHRCAAVLATTLGILWLANARMLMHGNESVHAYLVIVSVMLAALAALHGARQRSWRLVVASSLLCAVAMFSFGPGIATFAMVILLMGLHRAPKWLLVVPLCTLVASLGIYLFLLPGDEGVRTQMLLQPLENAAIALRWISLPWYHGWLATAIDNDPGWVSVTTAQQGAIGTLLVDSATAVSSVGEGRDATRAFVLLLCGVAGTLAWGTFGYRLWRLRGGASSAEWVAFGTAAFALATAALIGVARLGYFQAHPDQIYADRYLVWPSLFWASLLVLAVLAGGRSASRLLRIIPLLFTAALAVVMWPTHQVWAGWAGTVQRSAELIPIGAWTGVRTGVFPDGADATAEQVNASLAAMRRERIGPFTASPPYRLGATVRPAASVECGSARIVDAWFDPASGVRVARLEGWCDSDRLRSGGWLVVLDQQDRVRGFARWSWPGPGKSPFGIGIAPRHGYDGLIVGYIDARSYRVVAADAVHPETSIAIASVLPVAGPARVDERP